MRYTGKVRGIENDWSARDTEELVRWRADEVLPIRHASTRAWDEPGILRSISRAMSWLTTCIVEGFAAYAEAMHPCLVDRDDEAGKEQRRAPVPWPLFSSPWEFDAARMREMELDE